MLFFFVWFVSLSIMPSRSIHVVETGKIFFFFMGGYTSALHFLYSFIHQWRLTLFGSCKYCYKILKDDAVKVLQPICQQIWKIQQCPQDSRRSVFIPISKKGNAKTCSNYSTVVLISHATKVMLKVSQARLQQYVNWELPRCTSWISKRQRNQRSNYQHLLDHRVSKRIPENMCFTDYTKVFDHVDLNELWQILKERRISDHLTCLLRNLYAGQETVVRTGSETTDWFQIGKGVH